MATSRSKGIIGKRALEERRTIVAQTMDSSGEVGTELTIGRMREMALIDFVTDPEQRDLSVHYARVDRPWRKEVTREAFGVWAVEGNWLQRRVQWWSQIEARILAKRAEQMANQRISEIEAMESARDNMARYLFPLTTKGGAICLHPEFTEDNAPNPLAGLPVYGLRMPPLDRFINAFISLDKQIMLKRGEAIERATQASARLPEVTAHESGGVNSMSPEDLRAMAKVLVRRRQPELNDQPEIVMDTLRVNIEDE